VPGLPEPYDTAHLKVYYPAAPTDSLEERMSGVVTAAAQGAPLPIVILLPGINVGPESFRWWAEDLVARGYVVVTYALVGENFGGSIGITPGIDLGRLSPETFGTGPTASALTAVHAELAAINARAPLQGLLDLDRVAVGGHSAGGTVALQATDREWFPWLRAGFSYAAHTMAAMALGWPEGAVLPLRDLVPRLLVSGDRDGVMAASAVRYGEGDGRREDEGRVDPVSRTFAASLPHGHGVSHHLVIAGANHFLPAVPLDPTSSRSFLDPEPDGDTDAQRALLADVVGTFLDAFVKEDPAAAELLDTWRTQPPAGATRFDRD
jgi:dienelactone hydrolase